MKHEQSVQVITRIALARVQQEYEALKKSTTFSLQDLFNFDQFRLADFCKDFHPHPQSASLKIKTKEFCEKYSIWLENANQYISCALFLYPTAGYDRMLAMLKNLAIGYYLNDTIGRDLFRYTSKEHQQISAAMIQRMSELDESLQASPGTFPVELANLEMLKEIRSSSPRDWFMRFLKEFSYYIEITHRDCNASKYLPSVEDYVNHRYHTSGMPHIVLFIQYSTGHFIHKDDLLRAGIVEQMERLHKAAALIGALMNDMFSFEKEVIDNNCDSNLVMAIAMNKHDWSLEEILLHAAGIVRDLLKEYICFSNYLRVISKDLRREHSFDPELLTIHLDGLDRCVQASWLWQVYTKRYKRPGSIFKETRSVEETMTVSQ